MGQNRRLILHQKLKEVSGITEVYFQPPETQKMGIPRIIYGLSDTQDVKYANNSPYLHKKRYTITVIDTDPDSLIPDKMLGLPLCSVDRHYKANGLNHYIYNIYY